MISDTFRILIRDHFISRLWSWITGYAVLLVILGVTLLYERLDVLAPMRFMLQPWQLRWLGGAVYCASFLGVALSFLFGLRINLENLGLKADLAILNPSEGEAAAGGLSEIEQRAFVMLKALARIEGLQWSMACWPGFLGIIWYIFSGSTGMLLMYMAISMVATIYHRPSLQATEKLVEEYVRHRSPPFRTGGLS